MAEEKKTEVADAVEADAFDLANELSSLAPEDKLKKLHEMSDNLSAMNLTIEDTESTLEAMKSERHKLRIDTMPRLMADLGMPQFVYEGVLFEIGDLITGSFPKEPEARENAVKLLQKYEAEGLLVAKVDVQFPKSEYDTANRLTEFLWSAGYNVTITETIHTQTYNAFARRRLEEGEEIDIEGLGMFHNKIVKTKEVKEKAPKKGKAKK